MRIIDCVQGDEVWFAERRKRATASEFHRILTAKTRKFGSGAETYARQIVAERHALNRPADHFVSRAMQNGIDNEPVARTWYEFQYDVQLQKVGLIVSACERMACSPDAAIIEAEHGFEIKCPDPKTHFGWLIDAKLPDEHAGQCHGGLIVTGWSKWTFISYCPGLPELVIDVTRDRTTIELGIAMIQFHDRVAELEAQLERMQPR